jgi:hypothetical protein
MTYKKVVQELKLWGCALALSAALAAAHYGAAGGGYASSDNGDRNSAQAIGASASLF